MTDFNAMSDSKFNEIKLNFHDLKFYKNFNENHPINHNINFQNNNAFARFGPGSQKIKVLLYNYLTTSIPLDDIAKIVKKFGLRLKDIDNGDLILELPHNFTNMLSNDSNTNVVSVDVNALRNYFLFRLQHYLPFTNIINNRDAYYISADIPLFGILGFGIVDRGTNILELRPLTSCVFECIHCSINEIRSNSKKRDFFVDYQYMIDYTQKFIANKKNDVILFINPQGETMLYSRLVDLISGLKKIKRVKKIMIATRLPFWSEKLIDNLITAGLDQFNLSIDTLDVANYQQFVGNNFKVERVLKFIQEYHDKVNILLTPVWFPGINDTDLLDILKLAKKYNLGFGLQNYVRHKFGRKLKEKSWTEFEKFYSKLIKTIGYKGDHMFDTFVQDWKPESVFKLNEILDVDIVLPGRMMHEYVGVSRDRAITILNKKMKNIRLPSKHKVKIIRLNDNIAMGVLL